MKKTLLFLAFSFVFFAASAQDEIRGELSAEGRPMAFASVILKNAADSSVAKTALTDTGGNYSFKGMSAGSYFVETFFMGYSSYRGGSFSYNGGTMVLDPIIMLKSDEAIEGIQVRAMRPIIEIEPDKTVFNVENTLNASGSDAFELLRKAPGVVIDNNNVISLEGKSGVMVYIDGKQTVLSGDDLVNFLRSLQATDVDAVELITQPSSKYDAAGNAGIINIRLKRNKNYGTNGSIGLGHGYGKNHRTNSSLSLNHRNKHINLYSNFSGNLGKRWQFFEFDRLQQGVNYISDTENNRYVDALNGKVGMDWFVGKQSIIGVLLNANRFNSGFSGTTITEIIPLSDPSNKQLLDANNNSEGSNYQLMANVNYRYTDKDGREFNIDLDKGVFDRKSDSYQPNRYLDGTTNELLYVNEYRMITPTQIDITTAKFDYAQNIFKGKVSVGAKYSLVSTDNTFDFYDVDSIETLNTQRSNQFIYDENVNAAYINYAASINKKWKIQLGLRAEQTISRGELISAQQTEEDLVQRNYLNWFPSGGLTYAAGRNHMWTLNSSRRIQRPNYESLNPFETQTSELAYRKGNPFLQPQYTNNFKLQHTYKYRFNTAFTYSFTTDFFAQVTDTLGDTKSFIQPRNVANQESFSLTASLPFKINKWWSIFANTNMFYTTFSAADPKFQAVDQFTAGFYAQSSFLLPKGVKLELSGWGRTPSIWGGTYRTKSMGAMNIAAEKKLLNNQMSVRINFSDIFFSSPWRADLVYGDLAIKGRGGHESRTIDFSISYNFGNKEVKASRNRSTGLEEEQQRSQ